MTKGSGTNYSDYVAALKTLVATEQCDAFPRLTLIHGPSEFLRMRAMASIKNIWGRLDPSDPQHVEASTVDQVAFRGMWAQVSLFEPEIVYVVRRCDKHTKLATWLKEIKTAESIRTHLILEFGEKIPAEIQRQAQRLHATMIPCVEPTSAAECGKVVASLAKREGIVLAEDAIRLLTDAMGPDLAKLQNEIQKILLIHHGRKEPLRAVDIAGMVGSLREDHVFELFNVLRSRQGAKAQLLVEQLLDRGEKAIALTGILTRYARELIAKNPKKGVRGLRVCAETDLLLKSSRVSEPLILGRVVDALID